MLDETKEKGGLKRSGVTSREKAPPFLKKKENFEQREKLHLRPNEKPRLLASGERGKGGGDVPSCSLNRKRGKD